MEGDYSRQKEEEEGKTFSFQSGAVHLGLHGAVEISLSSFFLLLIRSRSLHVFHFFFFFMSFFMPLSSFLSSFPLPLSILLSLVLSLSPSLYLSFSLSPLSSLPPSLSLSPFLYLSFSLSL